MRYYLNLNLARRCGIQGLNMIHSMFFKCTKKKNQKRTKRTKRQEENNFSISSGRFVLFVIYLGSHDFIKTNQENN